MRMIGLIGLLVLTTACDGQMSCEELAELEHTVELGQGEDSFSRLETDDSLVKHFGPQGGTHSFLAVRTTGIHPGQGLGKFSEKAPEFIFTLFDGEEVVGEGYSSQVNLSGDSYEGERTGITALHSVVDYQEYFESELDAGTYPEDLGERSYLLRVEVTDSCGNVASDERQIRYALF